MGDAYAEDMGKKVNIQVGGETESQHRWSCLSCGTMGPWTSQTVAVVAGEAHEDQHGDEAHENRHHDEDLDEVLQNLTGPIEGDPPPMSDTDRV
jgi:hypothetical protein